jgi:hypothetical protein
MPRLDLIALLPGLCHRVSMSALLWILLGLPTLALASERPAPYRLGQPARYTGLCDASGAITVSSNLFVVADDERNVLQMYRTDPPGRPVKQFDFNAFLAVEGKSPEADLEAAARIGDRAFWISSYGRNRNDKERLNRHRFFATDILLKEGDVDLIAVGNPYKRLLGDFLSDARLDQFHLAEASLGAPKERGALNIEGLAATPEGHLLIGFRNPIPAGKALLIPLLNPNEVIQGIPAKFADPIRLDLGGLGIRDIAMLPQPSAAPSPPSYIIIAGSWHGGGHFRLYRWDGPGAKPKRLDVPHLNDYHPETLVIYPQYGFQSFQILSDDGTYPIDGCPCKDLPEPSQRCFRSFWVAR